MIIKEANRLSNVKEYYFSRKLQEIRKMVLSGKNVLNMGIGNPDLSPSESTINALIHSAKNPSNHGYQNYKSIPELREAIAKWNKRIYGTQLDAETELLPLIGSKEGIMHISMAFLNPGDEVLVPNPGYPTYTSVGELVSAKIRTYDLDENKNWAVDLDKLQKSDLSKVKLMWINYPNMPTGAQATNGMMEDLIALAKAHQFLLVNDNPYSLILNDTPKSIFEVKGAKEVALELNSLSKSHNMAGWRLGWVAGAADYINTIIKVKSNVDSGMFLPVQHAAVEALNNTTEWHVEQNKAYAERREKVWELFDLLKVRYDKNQVGMFLWGKVPDEIEDVETYVDEILYGANVFITPGFIFGSNGNRYVRISLCSKKEMIEEAINRLKIFIQNKVSA